MKSKTKINELFYHVGSVVVTFGSAEHSLDYVVYFLYNNMGGSVHSKKLPMFLSDKTIFLRKCANDKSLNLLKHTDDIISIAEKFDDISKQRNDIIHGSITKLSDNDRIHKFSKFDFKNDYHELREVHLDSQKFQELKKAILHLGSETYLLSRELLNTLKLRQ